MYKVLTRRVYVKLMHVAYVQKIVTKCAEILLPNARCHKMRRNFVTKCALSQNARCYKMRRNFVTKCARCFIMRSCYKMRLNTVQPVDPAL